MSDAPPPAGYVAPAPPPAPSPALADDAPLPFRKPRRNPARMWTALAVGTALVLSAAAGAVAWFGLPSWAVGLGLPGMVEEPDLVIELSPTQDFRELPDGTIYFAASGTIVNPSDTPQRVPPILAELRDEQQRVVYSWTINPPVRTLPPGEKAGFSEAKLDIPRAASHLTVSWALPGD